MAQLASNVKLRKASRPYDKTIKAKRFGAPTASIGHDPQAENMNDPLECDARSQASQTTPPGKRGCVELELAFAGACVPVAGESAGVVGAGAFVAERRAGA